MKIRADTQTYDIFSEQWLWLFANDDIAENLLKEETLVWTDSDILYLFEFLLQDSLLKLKDPRVSTRTKLEIYQWINNESTANPFSFENCCRYCGLDADFMREAVLVKTGELRRTLH